MTTNIQESLLLKKLSNGDLVLRMEKLVRTERKITHLVLLHIAEIEERKIYAEMGFDGMYSYLTKGLGYSEGSAYRRLQSARLLKQVPELAEKIETGSLNLSQLTQVQKCIKDTVDKGEYVSTSKTLEVLCKLENKNKFETQKTLAVELILSVRDQENIRPQKDESIRLEITLSKEQFAELENAKNLLSHVCPEGSWAEVIGALARKFNNTKLQGRTPSQTPHEIESENKKSSFVGESSGKVTPVVIAAQVAPSFKIDRGTRKRSYMSVHLKRQLLKKANYCCEYRDVTSKRRCDSKYFLEIEHIKPVSLGGTNEPANLRIFCREHNALAARTLGIDIYGS